MFESLGMTEVEHLGLLMVCMRSLVDLCASIHRRS
jgi:hypothetical protein